MRPVLQKTEIFLMKTPIVLMFYYFFLVLPFKIYLHTCQMTKYEFTPFILLKFLHTQ